MARPTVTCGISSTAPAAVPSYVDVSADFRSFSCNRGRSNELDHFGPGTITVVLDNRQRQHDGITPNTRLRIRAQYGATTYDVCNGFIDAGVKGWVHNADGTVTITATGGFKWLNNTLTSVYEMTVRDLAPIRWYRLSDPPGQTRVVDAMGNADGEVEGGISAEPFGFPALTRGETLTSASLINNGDILRIPQAIGGTNPWSIAFRYHPAEQAAVPAIITTRRFNSLNYFLLSMDVDGYLTFTEVTPASGATTVTSSWSITDGEDHSIALTCDGAGKLDLYIDDHDPDEWIGTAHNLQSSRIYVGNDTGDGYGPGNLAELSIYNFELSPAQVADLHSAATTPWADDLPGARLARLADAVGWPVADRDFDAGSSYLQLAETSRSSALSQMQSVESAEYGRIFTTAAGVLRLVGRTENLTESVYTTAQATFGDNPGELPYQDVKFSDDDTKIRNDVQLQRIDGGLQQVSDATSITTYGRKTYSDTSLINRDDNVVRAMANWLLAHYKDHHDRIESLQVTPERDPANVYPALLALELGYRVRVIRRPFSLGSPIDVQAHVEGISHSYDASSRVWRSTISLSPADTQPYWVISQSHIGTDTRIAF